jgi:hypothetical protein
MNVGRDRPEDMTTPRTSFKINDQHPGSDLAAETSAALVVASIAFRQTDSNYASQLLNHSKQVSYHFLSSSFLQYIVMGISHFGSMYVFFFFRDEVGHKGWMYML